MDYLYFVYGLAFILMAAQCVAMRRARERLIAWDWLAAFGFIHGLSEWTDLLGQSLAPGPAWNAMRLALLTASFGALVEFGRRSLRDLRAPAPAVWLYPLLAAPLIFSNRFDFAGLQTAARHGLGIAGTGLGAWALWKASRTLPEGRGWLAALGATLAAYGAFAGLAADARAFQAAFGFPVQIARTALAAAMTMEIRLYAHRELPSSALRAKDRTETWLVVLLAAVVACGGVFATILGRMENEEFEERFTSTAETVARSIGSSDLASAPGLEALAKRLRTVLDARSDILSMRVLALRGGEIVPLLSVRPDPGQEDLAAANAAFAAGRETRACLLRLFAGTEQSCWSATPAGAGLFFVSYARVRGAEGGRTPAVLGLGTDDVDYRQDAARNRLPAIILTLVSCLLLLGLFVVHSKTLAWAEELLESKERLRQAEKMTLLGKLAGGVAHDFNNILTAICGYCRMIPLELDDRKAVLADLGEIVKASERATALTRQMLAFSRKQVLEPKVLDLNAVIRDLSSMLKQLIRERIELRVLGAADLGAALADRGQVERAIMNLVVNARDAMPKGGEVVIETANAVVGEEEARAHPDALPGPYVVVSVRDTGVGMGPETLAHIFEPFFTTKGEGEGTGLGLSTVYGIARQSGGHVRVRSEKGKGSTFQLYFPRVAASVDAPNPRPDEPREERAPASETILLLEDDEAVRHLCLRLLTERGYRVLAATNGTQALELARRRGKEVDLLLIDTTPGEAGARFVELLRAECPRARVLRTSGSGDDAPPGRDADPGALILRKPFRNDELLRSVRDALA